MERFLDAGQPDRQDCSRPDLAAFLPRWDELEQEQQGELEVHARSCPACGPALEILARADAWLRSQAAPDGPSVCPSAEDLYAFGGGPGAEPLPDARRLAVAAHVAACFECEGFVSTLASRPPSPLILGPAEPAEEELPPPRRLGRLRRLVPALAAAAVVLAVLLLWRETLAGPGSGIRYPEPLVVRGEAAGKLLFPRDRVLASPKGGLQSELLFELVPEERATGYRLFLSRTEGGAFDRGTPVVELTSDVAVFVPSREIWSALTEGHYTWEAWAVVDGLDVPLGRRDFEVVLDQETLDRIEELRILSEPRGSQAILDLLHERYPSDARAFARTLPASPERDAYLARTPAR